MGESIPQRNLFSDSIACNNQAYINDKAHNFLTPRDSSGEQESIGIFPFDMPESFASNHSWPSELRENLGSTLTRDLLATGQASLIEFNNQAIWLGKRDDFDAGNPQAISLGRAAGYDLILLGFIDQPKGSEDTLAVRYKLIDVRSAVTVYYGIAVTSIDPSWLRILKDKPQKTGEDISQLLSKVSSCIVSGLTANQ